MSDSSQKIGILLVDDHPIIRFGFLTLLGQFDPGFEFYETDNAGGAMELAKLHRPRLAIVDLSLAGTLSLELIKRLRQIAPNCAKHGHSGRVDARRKALRRARAAGWSAWLCHETAGGKVNHPVGAMRSGRESMAF